MKPDWFRLGAIVVCLLGIVGCVIGATIAPPSFFQAWLCSYLFWLGVPLAGVTLVLVQDLTGGAWMATARPILDAAIATMPLATLAGAAAFIGLNSLYDWTLPAPGLANVFYLNPTDFLIRYGIYVVLWNLLAAFALWAPRERGQPIPAALSWISAVGLIALAFSASFAAIDWILSLEPNFWSSVFPYTQGASWFNTGVATVLLTAAMLGRPTDKRREHMSDLARILLATTIFWAYVEFMQFLIIWEENLKSEIPWYLKRVHSDWHPAINVSVGLGFVVPFLVLVWTPSKRNRAVVAAVCGSILISRLANTWFLVMPEFEDQGPFWLDVAAVLALGGAMVLLFTWSLRYTHQLAAAGGSVWTSDHA
jgi:hypothetical protein